MQNSNFKEKSLIEISDFIKKEIPFNEMEKNGGIYETSPIGKDSFEDDITIGVTYENIEWDENIGPRYYYNIFIGREYIDLGKEYVGYPNNNIPESTLIAVKKEICRLLV